jgi:hypothetical protein
VSDQSASPGRPLLVAPCPAAVGSAVPVQIPRRAARRSPGADVAGGEPVHGADAAGASPVLGADVAGVPHFCAQGSRCACAMAQGGTARATCVGNLPSTEYLRPARLGSADTIVRRRSQRAHTVADSTARTEPTARDQTKSASEAERADGGPHCMRYITHSRTEAQGTVYLAAVRCATEPTRCWDRGSGLTAGRAEGRALPPLEHFEHAKRAEQHQMGVVDHPIPSEPAGPIGPMRGVLSSVVLRSIIAVAVE